MFLAIARKLYLENIRDIPLRQSGTSRYSTEIADAFITVCGSVAIWWQDSVSVLRFLLIAYVSVILHIIMSMYKTVFCNVMSFFILKSQ